MGGCCTLVSFWSRALQVKGWAGAQGSGWVAHGRGRRQGCTAEFLDRALAGAGRGPGTAEEGLDGMDGGMAWHSMAWHGGMGAYTREGKPCPIPIILIQSSAVPIPILVLVAFCTGQYLPTPPAKAVLGVRKGASDGITFALGRSIFRS